MSGSGTPITCTDAPLYDHLEAQGYVIAFGDTARVTGTCAVCGGPVVTRTYYKAVFLYRHECLHGIGLQKGAPTPETAPETAPAPATAAEGGQRPWQR